MTKTKEVLRSGMKKATEPKSSPVTGHPQHSVRRQVLVSLLVAFFLIGATVLVILYGKGFRFTDQQGIKLSKTGILSLNSSPNGAAVYINDHMTVVTNNNSLNLAPGKYHVKIAKEGYSDWLKDFEIKEEQVSYAEATLFPQAPSLQSISTFGIRSTMIDPTGTKLAFNLDAGTNKKKSGIYVYDMTSRNFPVLLGQSNTTQIVDDSLDTFSGAQLAWSPDGKQIVASISAQESEYPTYYLLNATSNNPTPQDITAIYTNTVDLWKQQRTDKKNAQFKSLPKAVQQFAKKHWNILSWSPDDNEILYQATGSGQTPIFRKPRLIGDNTLYEQRHLEEGGIYVYNIKEDFNTRLTEKADKVCTVDDPSCNCEEFTKCPLPYTWMPDSNHLLHIDNRTIYVIEDDGSNKTTLYAGPFVDHYVFPWPDGSKVVILTNFNNSTVPPTLYTIGLK